MRVVRNILALLVNQVGTWIITLVLTIVLPHYLGVNDFGLYSFALAFAGFFALGMRLGTGTYLTWRIAREPEIAGRLTFNTLLLQVPLILACSAVAVLVFPLIDPDPRALQVMLLILLASCITSFSGTFGSALAGLQIMKTPAFITLFSAAVGMTLILAGTKAPIPDEARVAVIAVIAVLSEVITLVVLGFYTQRKLHLRFKVDATLWRTILLGGMPFFAWSVVLLFYSQIDITMIKVMVPKDSNEVVGWYAAAIRLTNIPLFLPMIVIGALLPALSQEHLADRAKFRDMVSRSLRIVTLVAVPAGVGVMILSNQLTALLHYPDTFAPVSILLRILALNVPLVAFDMILGTALIAAGRQRAWTVLGVCAGVFNPLVNLWAIPYTASAPIGNGAIGAAFVTVATEVVMFVGALYLRPKGIFTRWDVWYVGRCVLATAVMAPVVIMFSRLTDVGLFASLVFGVITYATSAYTLKLVRDDEILGVISVVTSRVSVALPFKAQSGTYARIPVVGADPSESLVNPIHSSGEWGAPSGAPAPVTAAAPLLSSDNWVQIIYADDDLDDTTLHETIPMHIAPSPANATEPRLHSSGVR
jgi:O-antigen/teichoic acid export membrane protein